MESNSESRNIYQDQLSGGSPKRILEPKPIHIVLRRGKNKGIDKGPEYSEDDEATLIKVKKLTLQLSHLIVRFNHPTRREDNPASLSLSGLQMFEHFSIQDGKT